MTSYSERTDKDGSPERYGIQELTAQELALMNAALLHYFGHLAERHNLETPTAHQLQHLIHITES